VTLALEIPVEERFVSLVRHVAAQAGRRAELSEDQIEDMRVAVTEVVSCALAAQRQAGQASPIRVEIAIGDPLKVVVLDRGGGTDPESIGTLLDDHNLGLVIARTLVDRLEVEPRPGGGSRVVLAMAGRPEHDGVDGDAEDGDAG
jgi:anti-sigma regulatory factor (Ser/Thr protein kinase)